MIKEDVKHLFDRSACLTKRQFEAYLQGNMITEEVYGIEHHINGCPLCSMAMDGMQLRKDALVVANQLNTDFLSDHLSTLPQQGSSGAASYVKNLKPGEINTKPLITGVKVVVAIGACAAILWFVQSVGKNSGDSAKKEEPQQEEVVNVATPPKQEEQSVVVEEPLMAEQTATEDAVAEPEAAPVKEQPVIGPPEDKTKPVAATSTKPATVPATITKPVTTTAKPPVTATKPIVPTTKPVTKPATIPAPLPKPAPPVVREEPKAEPPKPVAKEEPKPQPKQEQPAPAPAPKKEPVEELPSDAIAAGKTLMDKRNYNAAINRMRAEMRSSNKARRQEAVILVAKCYQQLGNKDRAAELLKSVVDEGGPEKKNAKKLLKEVDKNAPKNDE